MGTFDILSDRCLGVLVCVWLGRMLPSETVQKRKSSVRLRVEAA